MKLLAEREIQTGTGVALVQYWGKKQWDGRWRLWIGGDDYPNGPEEMGVFTISELFGEVTPEWLVEGSDELWAQWQAYNDD